MHTRPQSPRWTSFGRSRRGLNLTELMVAIAIAAGPLILSVHMIQSNAAGARFNRERATARLVLLDLATLVSGEKSEDLKTGIDTDPNYLNALLDKRIELIPEGVARDEYLIEAGPLKGNITGQLIEVTKPELEGLYSLILTAKLTKGNQVSIQLLFRPEARDRLLETNYPVPVDDLAVNTGGD